VFRGFALNFLQSKLKLVLGNVKFPSFGGVAKIQRIFDGVVQE
jgi:hypothetical protein